MPLSQALWGKVVFFSAFLLFAEALSSLSCFFLFSPLIHTPISRRQDMPPWTQECKCDYWACSTTQLGRQGYSHIRLGALGLNWGVPSKVRGSDRQACHLSPRRRTLGFNEGALPSDGFMCPALCLCRVAFSSPPRHPAQFQRGPVIVAPW